jgi:predicted HicB family RNase H-like nuclease
MNRRKGGKTMILERRGTTKGLVAFSVRIPPELKKKLEDRAYDTKHSLGYTVEKILTAAIEDTAFMEKITPRAG